MTSTSSSAGAGLLERSSDVTAGARDEPSAPTVVAD
jgi:hypothetical protein